MNKIPNFYPKSGYHFLSNFSDSPFHFFGIFYPNVETFYQAAKCQNISDFENVLNTSTAGQSKKAGKLVGLRKNWSEIKLDVMRLGLKLKFSDPDLKARLLATGDAILEEGNVWNDFFWGVDESTREGENHLGKLLMEIREEYKRELK